MRFFPFSKNLSLNFNIAESEKHSEHLGDTPMPTTGVSAPAAVVQESAKCQSDDLLMQTSDEGRYALCT